MKLSKIAEMRSAGMPTPVSETATWSAPGARSSGSHVNQYGEFSQIREFGRVTKKIQEYLPQAAWITKQQRLHSRPNPAAQFEPL